MTSRIYKYDVVGEYFSVDSNYYETLHETNELSAAIRWARQYSREGTDMGGYHTIFVHNNETSDYEFEITQEYDDDINMV